MLLDCKRKRLILYWKRYSKAFLISFHFSSLNRAGSWREQSEAQTLASLCVAQGTWPYLFISSAQWSQYLARNLLQKRMTTAMAPFLRLIHSRLIKKRITCTKHTEGDRGKLIENAVGTYIIMRLCRHAPSAFNLPLLFWVVPKTIIYINSDSSNEPMWSLQHCCWTVLISQYEIQYFF